MNGDNPPIMHYYTTQNGKIVREQWGSAQMDFVYDATGEPLALYYRVKLPNSNEYSGDSYYYENQPTRRRHRLRTRYLQRRWPH